MVYDKPDKSLIRKRFARSLKTYTDNASVQHRIANRLMSELIETAGANYQRICEIGCGTGLFTSLISEKLKYEHLYLNDLVEDCSFVADKYSNCDFFSGDIETIDSLPTDIDLVVSNAVFQWFHDMPATLAKIADIMQPGSVLAFSTFGTDNLLEVSSITGSSLEYLPICDLKEIISENFEVISCYEKWYFLEFESPVDVLKHLKQTGVTAISNQSWTKSDMTSFCSQYQDKFSTDKGVVLSYHPVIVVALKKEQPC